MTARLTIVVSRDLCESNGACVSKAPDVFALGDDDVLRLKLEHPDAEQLERVRAALRSCPKAALSLVER
jgi:ferredoxin